MYPLFAVFAGLSAAGLVMLIRAASSAPEGYEDAKGFHALNPNDLAAPVPAEMPFAFDDLLYLEKQLAAQPWH